MSKELQINYPTGATLYALLFNSVGQVWNGSSFETFADANLGNYDLALTEQGTASGFYAGDMPAVSAGVYGFAVRLRVGGSPAVSDPTVGAGTIQWSGTAEIPLSTILALLDDPRAEPGQGNPPANPDAVTKLDYLYKAWRNKKTETSTEQKLYADDGSTVDQKRILSDDGTTLTVGEIATGA